MDDLSYEKQMLQNLAMPVRSDVEQALLITMFYHQGVIKEFAAGEEIVTEIADKFSVSEEQRLAYLTTVYKKENRVKKAYLWHRLLFRAADALAKEKLVSRPTQTYSLNQKREWMLTEKGYDRTLSLLKNPALKKEILPIKSFQVEKIVKNLYEQPRPIDYNPFEKKTKVRKMAKLRSRAFRQAIIEAYNNKCAVCGMKIFSPDFLQCEVEAAHIVPHGADGKDDIGNGMALCRLHHWAFDVGWFSLQDNFRILASDRLESVPADFGKIGKYSLTDELLSHDHYISLPDNPRINPHPVALKWHRENIFCF